MRPAPARRARRAAGGRPKGAPPLALAPLAWLAAVALLAPPARAQDPPGTLRGTVVVAGAEVPLP